MTIKPCPFCGGRPEFNYNEAQLPEIPEPWWSLECSSENHCTAWPQVFGDTKAEAISKWNRRKGGKR